MKKQLKAIRKIDPAAAEYIDGVVIPRWGKKKVKQIIGKKSKLPWKRKNLGIDLLDLFIWKDSLQGAEYWKLINQRLNADN